MDNRIDYYPTHTHEGFKLRLGKPLPFGAQLVPNGINFSVFSRFATAATLVLYRKGEQTPMVEIPFPDTFRIGNVYSMIVFDLDIEEIEYGYRMDGPWDPKAGHRFDKTKVLLDPNAKLIGGRDVWRATPDWNNPFQHRSRIPLDDFDWEDDRPLEIPTEDVIVYEMHVRGFTSHITSCVQHPGTFSGIIEKIPYLKELGINCVELMPVYEFDEFENSRQNEETGELLLNYWGYSTVGFFAPKAGYAATGKHGMQVDEFKNLVKQLHKNGIEIILDVVFNHTAEGNERGHYISFRGLDNQTYYMLTPEGYYYNFSGCGNTLNCNNPLVRQTIIDCLRYWASEYHIDGFRFDLAAILGRDPFGAPMSNPPLLESLAFDPILAKCKLIAEAWDAGGLYQIGSFPAYGRWAEWNGKYRDCVRRFLKGDTGLTGELADRIAGSPDLYGAARRGPTASINFITCHDGFTLNDMMSYNGKHNEANGENNRDGSDDNFSWNCGWEGPSTDPNVNQLRMRQMKNALTLLLVSQGVPMILMGDEFANTQGGNNNAYCHDTELSWLNWGDLQKNQELFRYCQRMIAIRQSISTLRNRFHFQYRDYVGSGIPDISFHGIELWKPDFSPASRVLSILLCGKHAKAGAFPGPDIQIFINSYWDALPFAVFPIHESKKWQVVVNTGVASPHDIWYLNEAPVIENTSNFIVGGRSIVILASK